MPIFKSKVKNTSLSHTKTDLTQVHGINDYINTPLLYTRELFRRILIAASNNIAGDDNIKYTLINMYSPLRYGLIEYIILAMEKMGKIYLRKELNAAGGFYMLEKALATDAVAPGGDLKAEYVELDFSEYYLFEEIRKLYSILANTISSTEKSVVVANAIILKLRGLTDIIYNETTDKAIQYQLKSFIDSLQNRGIGQIDAESDITVPSFSTETATETIQMIDERMSALLGLSVAFLSGKVTTGLGMGDDGNQYRDNLALEKISNEMLIPALFSIYNKKFDYVNPLNMAQNFKYLSFIETTTLLSEKEKLEIVGNLKHRIVI